MRHVQVWRVAGGGMTGIGMSDVENQLVMENKNGEGKVKNYDVGRIEGIIFKVQIVKSYNRYKR